MGVSNRLDPLYAAQSPSDHAIFNDWAERIDCDKFPSTFLNLCTSGNFHDEANVSSAIDLNCDLGEGMASDAELLQIVSSANIACGGHAGNSQTMTEALSAAKHWGVKIGAHPGYRDREYFGRRPQSLSDTETQQLLNEQIEILRTIATAQGSSLTHVRAHGALGNLTDADPHAASLLCSVAEQQGLAVMVLGQSAAEKAAVEAELPVIRQFFADRAYDRNGQLVPRSTPGSVLHEPQRILPRLLSALDSGKVTSIEGELIPVSFDTICVHGDTDSALALAAEIRHALEQHGVTIRPYPQLPRSPRP